MLKQRNDNLTKSQELELGVKIQKMKEVKMNMDNGVKGLSAKEYNTLVEGDDALELLISNYYNLARSIAHKHHKRTGTRYAIDDLIQDAVSALVEAAYAYDPDKDCRLSTYAFYGITKRVSTTINFQRLVRLPENKMGEYITIVKAQKEYGEMSKVEQSKFDSELSYVYENVGDLKSEEVDLILTNMQPQVSLNADISDGNGSGELMDFLKDEGAEAEIVESGYLDENTTRVISRLNEYEKDLIAFEFGAFPASMDYSDFLIKYDMTDRKVKLETRKAVSKMKKIAKQSKLTYNHK